jgi:hypothetical protein
LTSIGSSRRPPDPYPVVTLLSCTLDEKKGRKGGNRVLGSGTAEPRVTLIAQRGIAATKGIKTTTDYTDFTDWEKEDKEENESELKNS